MWLIVLTAFLGARPVHATPTPTPPSAVAASPVAQASPAVAASPVAQASPAVAASPVAQASPAVAASPVAQTSPSVEPSPARQPSPAAEPSPAAQPSPAAEPSPSAQPSPSVEPSPPAATGQFSAVNGVVTDDLSRPLAGVDVRLLSAAGQVVTHATTDKDGKFKLGPVPDGTYTLKLNEKGFKPSIQTLVFPAPTNQLSINLESTNELEVTVKAQKATGLATTPNGAVQYSVSAQDIQNRPLGENANLAQILSTMPGVALDQNQNVHIRDQHGNAQYMIDGFLLPLSMYASSESLINLIDPHYIKQVDLVAGIMPAQYGFTNSGGTIAITTKDGTTPGGSVSMLAGMRGTLQPSVEYGGTDGRFNFFVSGMYDQTNVGFSSATPGPGAVHDATRQDQGFGYFGYKLSDTLKLIMIDEMTDSTNQLPNQVGLTPQYSLNGITNYPSQQINSYLNFHDRLSIIGLEGTPDEHLKWQFAYTYHTLQQYYQPDVTGELLYAGVAAHAFTLNRDNSLQGDVTYTLKNQTLGLGFYYGRYNFGSTNTTQVFPGGPGFQTSTIPVSITNNYFTGDTIQGYYFNDLWQLAPKFKVNLGVRYDQIAGWTTDSAVEPTVNLIYSPDTDTTIHGGWAHYMDMPMIQTFAPNGPASFNGTTNQQIPGVVPQLAQKDEMFDAGVTHSFNQYLAMTFDSYYTKSIDFNDEGNFGVIPIFVGLNWERGNTWGEEVGLKYKKDDFTAFLNWTVSRSQMYGVATGQFNFQPAEIAFLATSGVVLDHAPLDAVSLGTNWKSGPWTLSMEGLYGSGLRSGFANTLVIPAQLQFDVGVQRDWNVQGIGKISDRISILNVLDRTNEIRPTGGIGVFQAAYGPRFTIFDTLTVPIH